MRARTATAPPLVHGTLYRLTVETTERGSHRLTVHDERGNELAQVSMEDA